VNNINKKRKGQAWSLDLIIGVVIFILVVVILYSVLSTNTPKNTKLRQQADTVSSRLERGTAEANNLPSIIQGSELNQTALGELYMNSSNYEALKTELGIKGDVCIVLVDELGGIVDINGKTSFGNPSDNLNLSKGIICGD